MQRPAVPQPALHAALGFAAGAGATACATLYAQGPLAQRRRSAAAAASLSSSVQRDAAAAAASVSEQLSAPASQATGGVTLEALGRGTWTLLHTYAASLPARLSAQQQADARNLARPLRPATNACEQVAILTRVYPCEQCATHFADFVREHPPAVSTAADFSAWMCAAHNNANALLGKPAFDCSRRELRSDRAHAAELLAR